MRYDRRNEPGNGAGEYTAKLKLCGQEEKLMGAEAGEGPHTSRRGDNEVAADSTGKRGNREMTKRRCQMEEGPAEEGGKGKSQQVDEMHGQRKSIELEEEVKKRQKR
ncbi:hypothetical protein WR25_06270 [Diploscapter pachys]|uniref:Uncharacterized protein n=1 Tax=Diploscapter pachys TaxID=2018661 RepID=A0A2A2LXD5_9BILA|nr:hypothetical protein WR25_06270 [Diploscapter pachys]